MIQYIYTLSYLLAAAGLVGWFILQDSKTGTLLRNVFFMAILAYAASWWFAPSGMIYKFQILARDFGILGMLGALFSYFRHNRLLAAAAVSALVFLGGSLYLTVLQNTFQKKAAVGLATDGELLVELKAGHQIAELQNWLDDKGFSYQSAFTGFSSPEITELDDYFVVDVSDAEAENIAILKKELLDMAAVEWVEDNEIVVLDDSPGDIQLAKKKLAPNDPFVQNQWGFEEEQIGVLHHWLIQKKIQPKKRAKIAILDTGVDATHEDLKDNFVSTKAKYDTDKQAHGTHCAGIAAGVTGNKIGIASVVHNNEFVQVTSIKVLNDYGRGTEQTIINGILEAADNGADVISMSLGGVSSDSRQRAYQKAVEYAAKKGAIVVAAAGNSNMNAKDYVPAGVTGVIAVSAVDAEMNRASFSNYVSDVKMGVAAPGVDIFSTIPNNKYASFNGTSMACPHVAGLIGLLRALEPSLTSQQVFDILNNTGIETKDNAKTGRFIQPLDAVKTVLGE